MPIAQFRLLCHPRFRGLWLTQLLGAFNDNILKSSILIYIVYVGLPYGSLSPDILSAVATGLLILPFFFLSGVAGELADKRERASLICRIKLAEVLLMLLTTVGFILASVPLLLFFLFLMGCQSAFFGPLKYGVISDLLSEEDLVTGNAWINASTFVSILAGTMVGTSVIVMPQGTLYCSALLIFIAILGWRAAYWIPALPAPANNTKVNWNLWSSCIEMLHLSLSVRLNRRIIGYISWFWFLGASFLSQLPSITKSTFHADQNCVTFFLLVFSVGVALGALSCKPLLKSQISVKFSPWAGIFLGLFLIDFTVGMLRYSGPEVLLPLRTVEQFLNATGGIRIIIDLLALSFFSGLYVVPFYALLQVTIDAEHRSRLIGAMNIITAFWMTISSVFLVILLKIDIDIRILLQILAGLTLIISVRLGHAVLKRTLW